MHGLRPHTPAGASRLPGPLIQALRIRPAGTAGRILNAVAIASRNVKTVTGGQSIYGFSSINWHPKIAFFRDMG